jgi:hypothetical protein
MSEITVIIPTYWTWPASESARPEIAAYDHPTPLDGDSTLPRLLDDLAEQHFKGFKVLVLTGLSHPELSPFAAEHMSELLAPYRSRLSLITCDGPAWNSLKTILDYEGLPTNGLHLGSYSGIRNLQLLIPHILGARIIIALDDDERVEADYLERALTHIGKNASSKKILGLAGPYLQADGSVYLARQTFSGNVFVDKGYYINEAMRILMSSQGTLAISPMALGGNMIFHQNCFTRVPFDPGITRGEDIDYLINARLDGIDWWFDADLSILHLPPKHYDTPRYQRMREDVFRFIYEREKLKSYGVIEPEWLDPYPGALLKENLIEQARTALESEKNPELVARFGDPEEIIEQARAHAAFHLPRYRSFVSGWITLMDGIEQNKALREKLSGALDVALD